MLKFYSKKSIGLISFVMVFLIAACGQEQTASSSSSPDQSRGHPGTLSATACYLGADQKQSTCLPLITINAVSLGYKNPQTEAVHPLPVGQDPKQYVMPVAAVNLPKVDSGLFLAPDFRVMELMSAAKDNFGIFSPAVLKIVQQLRNLAKSAISVTSGFRSPKYNAGVDGSATWSRHQYGDAVDIESSALTQTQLLALCTQLNASFTLTYTDGHIHCDWRSVALDDNFYGPKINPGIRAELPAMARQRVMESFKQASQIIVRGELVQGNIVLLSSTVAMKDDPEDVVKKWLVTAPNGETTEYDDQAVSLPLMLKGNYLIQHNIGLTATLTKTLTVN